MFNDDTHHTGYYLLLLLKKFWFIQYHGETTKIEASLDQHRTKTIDLLEKIEQEMVALKANVE